MISHPPPHSSEYLHRLYVSGMYAECAELWRENLEHLRKTYGEQHRYVRSARGCLARILHQNGEFASAERELIDGILDEANLSEDHREQNASMYMNLTHLYLAMRRVDDAESALKRAQELLGQMTNPPRRSLTAAMLHSARIAAHRGRLADAEPLMTAAVESTLDEFGPKHLRCGSVLDHLSELYALQGRTSEAEATIRQALAAYQARETAEYAMSLSRLGLLRGEQGDWEEAEKCHQQALEILRRVRPRGHRNITDVEARLASAKQSRE